jgi:hypothetical protein
MQRFSCLHMRMTGGLQMRRSPAKKPSARFRPQPELLECRDLLSTLTVSTNLDSGTGSLRAEIAAAHAGDTIVFAPSLNGQTITLTSGELDINKSLSINGPAAGQLSVSGGYLSRVFEFDGSSTNVTLSQLTITHGNGQGDTLPFDGGGILNNGSKLTLSGCTVSGNSAGSGNGGGIYNSAGTSTLTVSACVLSNNGAYDGGGVYNSAGATATFLNSTLGAVGRVPGNTASGGDYDEGDGGAVFNLEGTVALSGCTLSGNSAGLDGGAVYTYGYVEADKQNKVVIGTMTISGCTVTGNSAFEGAGFYNASAASSAKTVMITNSSLSKNGNPAFAYWGPFKSGGGNSFA